jgi:hypothetical protein
MDNGLIFPYRFTRAHDERSDAKPTKSRKSSDGIDGVRDPNC